MGLFEDIENNKLGKINSGMKQIGVKHNAEFITDRMKKNDLVSNVKMIESVQHQQQVFADRLYDNNTCKNVLLKKLAITGCVPSLNKQSAFTNLTVSEHMILEHYFKICCPGERLQDYYDSALDYRAYSQGFQVSLERIALNIKYDSGIILMDTRYIRELIACAESFRGSTGVYEAELLRDFCEFANNRMFSQTCVFNDNYFQCVDKLSNVVKNFI